MPSQTTPYRGIDAHLNSLLQTPGTRSSPGLWHSFHTSHVTHIADLLNQALPENYVARAEQSLQIRTLSFDFGASTQERRPDISIYGRSERASPQRGGLAIAEEIDVLELSLTETLDLDEDGFSVTAVVILQTDENDRMGSVVTRIELISPSNKPGADGYDAYTKSRNEALYSLIPLVELDYLHETPLPFNHHRTHAYTIAVSDPRPAVSEGRAKIYNFQVDKPFPVVNIPLGSSDSLNFDFGEVYRHTFERGRWGRDIDYSALPERFGTYSPDDQERIRAVMQRVSAP